MRTIYFDYNATTPIAAPVQEAMLPHLAEHHGNPSSSHAVGRAAREALENARAQVAALIGAGEEEVTFTSGGTESNNMALLGTMLRGSASERGHLIISAFEHPAIIEPARYLQTQGCEVTIVPCDAAGVVDPDEVAAAIRPDTRLCSIMHANNEIGTIQAIREITQRCHARGVLVHTDAAQSAGKIPAEVDQLEVDMLSLAGHKLYAPKGIGALYVRSGVDLSRIMHGASQERGLRPGTENVCFAVGMGRAATMLAAALSESQPRLLALRDQLAAMLKEGVGEGLTINGEAAERLPNTLSVNFPDVIGSELLKRTPDLYASTGAACHANTVALSQTMQAIGVDEQIARGTVRLSIGSYTDGEEIESGANRLIAAWESLRG